LLTLHAARAWQLFAYAVIDMNLQLMVLLSLQLARIASLTRVQQQHKQQLQEQQREWAQQLQSGLKTAELRRRVLSVLLSIACRKAYRHGKAEVCLLGSGNGDPRTVVPGSICRPDN
jgi:hypothetical protein